MVDVPVPPEPYYSDELVTLYHGDCRKVAEWLRADVLITDPPYGIGWRKGTNKAANSYAHIGIQNDHDTSCRDWAIAAFGDKPGIVFGTWAAPFPPSKVDPLVWRKPVDAGVVGSVTGYRRDTELIFLTGTWPKRNSARSSVFETNGSKNAYVIDHPHGKPVALLVRLMEWTIGTIADPFAGSGSTLVAAKQLGQPAIGVEIEERFCEIAARRLSQSVLDFGAVSR